MQSQTQSRAEAQTTTSEQGAKSPSSGGGGGNVQLKASLRGMSYDDQVAALNPVQAKGDTTGDVHAAAAQGVEGGGGALPHLAAIQKSFGSHDVSGVAAHVGGKAESATKAMGANAYASGNDVAFGKSPDLHTAAHEAAHVVQQRGGVSLSGGVGKAGDSYEKHADSVADQVVAGKSSQALLDTMSGGGGGAGVQKQAVQMDAVANDQSRVGGQQTDLSSVDAARESDGRTPVDATTQAAVENPLSHPYFPTFKARVAALFASGKVGSPPRSTDAIATQIWTRICNAMKAAQPSMNDPAAYSDWGRKYVDMTSSTFQKAMGEFTRVCGQIAGYSSTQFANAKSFGFWSKSHGRALGEKICDVTLEMSGIGALFDGLPSLDGAVAGWDVDLWAGLSNAYATAVASAAAADGKRIHVCMGDNVRPDNIWGIIESKAVAKGLRAVGLTMADRVTYHGAACKKKDRKDLDLAQKKGEFHGTVYSGKSRDEAATAATAHYATLTA